MGWFDTSQPDRLELRLKNIENDICSIKRKMPRNFYQFNLPPDVTDYVDVASLDDLKTIEKHLNALLSYLQVYPKHTHSQDYVTIQRKRKYWLF